MTMYLIMMILIIFAMSDNIAELCVRAREAGYNVRTQILSGGSADGYQGWKDFLGTVPESVQNSTYEWPVGIRNLSNEFYKKFPDFKETDELSHFVHQLISLPHRADACTLHRLLQWRYNTGQFIASSALYSVDILKFFIFLE